MGLVIKLSKNIRFSLLPLALILFTSNSPVIAESYQLFIIAGENNKGIFNPFETYKKCRKAGEDWVKRKKKYDKGYVCKKIDWSKGMQRNL